MEKNCEVRGWGDDVRGYGDRGTLTTVTETGRGHRHWGSPVWTTLVVEIPGTSPVPVSETSLTVDEGRPFRPVCPGLDPDPASPVDLPGMEVAGSGNPATEILRALHVLPNPTRPPLHSPCLRKKGTTRVGPQEIQSDRGGRRLQGSWESGGVGVGKGVPDGVPTSWGTSGSYQLSFFSSSLL